jgi:predicted HTH transcriptional regulator
MDRTYEKVIEESMKNFYNSLSEKDKRRYSAVEALKLPHGSMKYISNLLGCSFKTIQQGLSDLKDEEQLKKNG